MRRPGEGSASAPAWEIEIERFDVARYSMNVLIVNTQKRRNGKGVLGSIAVWEGGHRGSISDLSPGSSRVEQGAPSNNSRRWQPWRLMPSKKARLRLPSQRGRVE